MKKRHNNNIQIILFSLIIIVGLYGCQPEEPGVGNGLTDVNLKSEFTVMPVAGKMNTYALKVNPDNVLAVNWDLGDGAVIKAGKLTDTIVYEDAGSYTITAEVIGRGGALAVSSKTVIIETSVPIENNLIEGAYMDPGDEDKWSYITYTPGVAFNIVNGKMIVSGGNGGHAAMYQAVQLQNGKKYAIDMTLVGLGATDTWFEVYLGNDVPGGSDYNSGGTRLALNTWNGCGNNAFAGKLSELSCAGSGNPITATQTGTAYLVIRTGGANLGPTGISIDRVSLVEVE